MLITERKLLERFNAAFNRHDVPAMMALMTDDCVFDSTRPPPDGERLIGQAERGRTPLQYLPACPLTVRSLDPKKWLMR